MYGPQITMIALLGVGINLANNGKPRTGNQSFFVSLTAAGITTWLLYMGGFFGGAC